MKDELVERLKNEFARNGGQGSYAWVARELCGKAADEILSLQSQLAAAQEKLAMAEGAFKDIATAQRLGPVTDTTAWARLANACQETATDALAALREPAAEEGRG